MIKKISVLWRNDEQAHRVGKIKCIQEFIFKYIIQQHKDHCKFTIMITSRNYKSNYFFLHEWPVYLAITILI